VGGNAGEVASGTASDGLRFPPRHMDAVRQRVREVAEAVEVVRSEDAEDVVGLTALGTTPSPLRTPLSARGTTTVEIALGGHPKPANDGHLKTGQR
jgi:hypothetical protein